MKNITIIQKRIIILGLLVIVIMALFPSWIYTLKDRSVYSETSAGYSFIGSPPANSSNSPWKGIKLDMTRLSIQTIAVITLTGIGLMLSNDISDRKKHKL